jgi:flagellar hook-basal body complex protein FliE
MSNVVTGLGSIGTISPLPKLSSLAPAEEHGGFSGVLSTALQHLSQLSGDADQQVGNLLKGVGGDVSTVMIAVEKASAAFSMMMQVRNKIVNAYQDIEKMQF